MLSPPLPTSSLPTSPLQTSLGGGLDQGERAVERLGTTRGAALEELARVCRRGRLDLRPSAGEPTGFSALDTVLPGGGWPVGALTEFLHAVDGIGELRLLMPALARLTRAGQYIAWVDAPYLAYPPALAQQGVVLEKVLLIRSGSGKNTGVGRNTHTLWVTEQLLRCPAFGAVLAWPRLPNDKSLRRLQLAAEVGRNLAILYRPASAAARPSPAALRLQLHGPLDGQSGDPQQELSVTIHKCRGQRAGMTVRCRLGDNSPSQPSLRHDFLQWPLFEQGSALHSSQ